jgi:hypothetical protein
MIFAIRMIVVMYGMQRKIIVRTEESQCLTDEPGGIAV